MSSRYMMVNTDTVWKTGKMRVAKFENPLDDVNIKKKLFDKERLEEQEFEEKGLPSFTAIDKLKVRDTFIRTTGNILVSWILGDGYKIIHKEESRVLETKRMLINMGFDLELPIVVRDTLDYGNGYFYSTDFTFIQRVLPEFMRTNAKGEYFYVSEEPIPLETQGEIFHFKLDPEADYLYGMSIWHAALDLLETWYLMNPEFKRMIDEYVSPILHGKVGGDTPDLFPSDEAINDVTLMVQKGKRPGTAIITDKLIDFEYIQPDRGMDLTPYIQFYKEKLYGCSMVPEPFRMYRSNLAAAGDSDKQEAAFIEWISFLHKFVFEPIINYQLFPRMFGKDEWSEDLPQLSFNPPIDYKLKDLNHKIKRVGVVNTVNEIRLELGYNPLTDEELTKMQLAGQPEVDAEEEDSPDEKQVRVSEGEKYE